MKNLLRILTFLFLITGCKKEAQQATGTLPVDYSAGGNFNFKMDGSQRKGVTVSCSFIDKTLRIGGNSGTTGIPEKPTNIINITIKMPTNNIVDGTYTTVTENYFSFEETFVIGTHLTKYATTPNANMTMTIQNIPSTDGRKRFTCTFSGNVEYNSKIHPITEGYLTCYTNIK